MNISVTHVTLLCVIWTKPKQYHCGDHFFINAVKLWLFAEHLLCDRVVENIILSNNVKEMLLPFIKMEIKPFFVHMEMPIILCKVHVGYQVCLIRIVLFHYELQSVM